MKKVTIKLDLDDMDSVMKFLQQPTLKIAEGLTGILASDFKDLKLSAGKIVQATIKGNLLTQLGREIKQYRDAGKIKEDYFESSTNRSSLKELLEFIDKEVPDEIRFKAMKSIFLSSINGKTNESLAYELMQICKRLSSMEILILFANYRVAKNIAEPRTPGINLDMRGVDYWAQIIAEQIGHGLPEIVMQYEDHLITLRLIADRHYAIDKTRVSTDFVGSRYFRLTNLGYKLCEFCTEYE